MKWHLEHARFGNQPWKVQEAYLKRASGKTRFGNFSQQGLGKTAATLNEYVTLVEEGEVDLCIVLAPSSFIGDWPLAVPEWGLEMEVGKWNGKDSCWPFKWETGLLAIAHETLRGSERVRDGLIRLLKERKCFLVFDESSGIKNPSSLLAKFMIGEVCKYVKHLRVLNGTPIVQNAMDYYAQLRCLGELNGMNPYAFRNRFCIMGGFMGKQIKGIKNEDELARILDRCSFRALKKDWRKDLPEQIEVPIYLEMTKNQLVHDRTMVEEFYAEISDGEIFAELTLTQRLKLAQISSCLLMHDGKTHWIEEPNNNPKVRAIHDLLEVDQTKTIIVYIFDASGRMLIDEMTAKGLNPAWITGGMKSEELLAQKNKFNNDPTCRTLIGQEDQTSRGHTLIGQKGDRCSRMVYYENSLSLMHRLQMNDRNHRGEQDETCTIFDLIPSPIDQINVDILQGKRSQADGMDALIAEIRTQHGDDDELLIQTEGNYMTESTGLPNVFDINKVENDIRELQVAGGSMAAVAAAVEELAPPEYREKVTSADVGRLSAEAVAAHHEEAAKSLELLGKELGAAMVRIAEITQEAAKAFDLIRETAEAYRADGRAVAGKIEKASELIQEVHKTCETLRGKLGEE